MLLTQLRAGGAPAAEAWAQPSRELGAGGQDFGAYLNRALAEVNSLQQEADRQAQLVATGQAPDLTEAVMAMNRAHMALQLTLAVTSRAVEAYREISHMQV